ncbi:MAG TPA: universal stress protein [Alphaproteobacteria bacterium]|nr:universal stress protein [Alphaproteobacteria bacterium]
MPYKSILVHVDTGAAGERRLALAASLAERHNAHLIGLSVVLPPTWGGIAGMPQLVLEIEKANQEYFDACRALFQQATESRAEDSEFRFRLSTVRATLTEESAFADLVVVSDTTGEPYEESSFNADDAILSSSAPVLVLPHNMEQTFDPKTVFIAWKPTREAARAVRDALPILREAEEVVACVVAPDEASGRAARLEDVGVYLERHGVTAEAREVSPEGSVGRTIIDMAEKAGADLIVAGGYGHAPLREWLMGGVTEALLHHSPIPCLISH